MVDRMLPFWKNGIQIHSHANGDETVDMTLNTLNALQNAAPRFDHRFTIEHYCIQHAGTGLGVLRLWAATPALNPTSFTIGHRFTPIMVSADRAEAASRLGSLVRAGDVAAFGLQPMSLRPCIRSRPPGSQ
ncbi:MAG: hypothetical protein R3E84_12805 [Pseudomonadales bacterium]